MRATRATTSTRRPPGLPELRAAIAAKTAARLRLRGRRRARCSSPTAASTRSTTRSRRCSTRATRCSSPRRTGPPTPRRSSSPTACPSRCSRREAAGFRVTVDQLEAAAHAAHEGAAVRVAEQPDRRGLPARRGRGDRALGASSTASGSSPTRSTSTSPTATTSSRRCRRWCPSSPTRCVVLNGVAKTYAMTGWRVGWMIGPPDVTAAATNLQSHQTSNVADVAPARRARRGVGRPRRGGRDARRVRPPWPGRCTSCSPRSRASPASSRRARSTASRRSRACSVASSAGARRRPRSSCASCCSTRPRSRSCPARRSARPATPGCRSRSADDDARRGRRAHRQVPRLLSRAARPRAERGSTGRPVASTPMKRVLVSEQLAASGLEAMRGAGLEVDVRLGLVARGAARGGAGRGGAGDPQRHAGHRRGARRPATTSSSSGGPASASTTSTSQAATRRGVMVVNAPQSNVLSAAEHTIALLLAQARNIPQADRDLTRRPVEPHPLGGRRAPQQDARHRRPRAGSACSSRSGRHAFGMQLVAYDPYVSADRARQLGVELVPTRRGARSPGRLPHRPPAEDARHHRV